MRRITSSLVPSVTFVLFALLALGLGSCPGRRAAHQDRQPGGPHRAHLGPGQGHRPGPQRRGAVHQREGRRQRQEARARVRGVRLPAAARRRRLQEVRPGRQGAAGARLRHAGHRGAAAVHHQGQGAVHLRLVLRAPDRSQADALQLPRRHRLHEPDPHLPQLGEGRLEGHQPQAEGGLHLRRQRLRSGAHRGRTRVRQGDRRRPGRRGGHPDHAHRRDVAAPDHETEGPRLRLHQHQHPVGAGGAQGFSASSG